MKITIIGWYGTETIGDRAILAGLISFFNKTYDNFEIKLGSLYPFFSQRSINEDYSFYKEIIKKDFKIDIFNSKKSKELVNAIKDSDLVVMGGGPLMDLAEVFMVEYAFRKAKKIGVKTALLGCGIGPLFCEEYKKSVFYITKNSDLIILRDNVSKNSLREIYRDYKQVLDDISVYVSYDPAVECTLEYKKSNNVEQKKYIAVNLREFPTEYNNKNDGKNINIELERFIKNLALKYKDRDIRLIPMHYFHIGGDDRAFLNSIAINLNLNNIKVQNPNLSLKQTLDIYQGAYINIGMRFHSVVLQTIGNGKNYVLDYTEPKKGKIYGFLKDIDKTGFYKSRYLSLQEDNIEISILNNEEKVFELDAQDTEECLRLYVDKLSCLL